MIDFIAVRGVPERLGRAPRALDVACGTGILLKQLIEQVSGIEAYGIDASVDMLAQAHIALKDQPHVQLEQVEIGTGETAGLPFAPGTFDLITCTNVLHDLVNPGETLAGLRRLLAPGGQLVVEDFARRKPPLAWVACEWLLRRIEGTYVRAYTLAEAQSLCRRAGLYVAYGRAFTVDRLWHGWVVRTYAVSSETGSKRA